LLSQAAHEKKRYLPGLLYETCFIVVLIDFHTFNPQSFPFPPLSTISICNHIDSVFMIFVGMFFDGYSFNNRAENE